MDNCTYENNPEITGRGILLSFYFQGFLMAFNGLLCIDKHELMPSFVTIFVICGVLLYEVIREESVFLSLVLHLLLCFHVLALHAVVVWVVEKGNLRGHHAHRTTGSSNPAYEPRAPWRTLYHFAQIVGIVVLMFSIYFIAFKECTQTVEGLFFRKRLPFRGFLLLTLLPYVVSTLATLLLRYYPKESGSGQLAPPIVHSILIVLWILSLATVIIFLEFNLSGNHPRIVEAGETVSQWSFGQVLPLALAITPAGLFLRNIRMRFKHKEPTTAPGATNSPDEQLVDGVSNAESIPIEDMDNSSDERPAAILSGFQNITDTRTTSLFQNAQNVRIAGGQFHNIVGDTLMLKPRNPQREDV